MALCWICKAEEGTTREHRPKRSDLKAVLGDSGPLYLHNDKRRNRKIQSINSKLVKFSPSICNTCNSARTQPHDRAWEILSEALRNRNPPIKPGDIIRADRIFRYKTSQEMLNMPTRRLSFTKSDADLIHQCFSSGRETLTRKSCRCGNASDTN